MSDPYASAFTWLRTSAGRVRLLAGCANAVADASYCLLCEREYANAPTAASAVMSKITHHRRKSWCRKTSEVT
jgi:hypothetical protein